MKRALILLLTTLLLCTACHDDKPEPAPKEWRRVIVVCIWGENSLSSYLQLDLDEIRQGYKDIPDGCKLVVYFDTSRGSERPYILTFECQKGQTNEGGISFHIDSDEGMYISAMAGIGTRKLSGLRFVSEFKIGHQYALNLDLSYKAFGNFPVVGLAMYNSFDRFHFMDQGLQGNYTGMNNRLEAYLEDSKLVRSNIRIGAALDFEPFENYLDQNMSWSGWDLLL